MTPQEALQVLGQVAAKFVGTLADHNAIQQALQVIDDALKGAKDDKAEGVPELSGPND